MSTFMSKHAANLLNINPMAKRASAMEMKGDLDKDGSMSSYETTRQKAIEKNMKK